MASTTGQPAVSGRRRRQTSRQSSRSRLATITGAQILGVGHCAPGLAVPNEALAELGYDADWIVQRTGIKQRYQAADCDATSDVAARAAVDCLANADATPEHVDLILVATITPDTLTPATACHVQKLIGATAPAMDISAACAGFMYAMVTGMQFVRSGNCQRVLVIGADLMSRISDPTDKKTFPLFGDGAGAVLLGPGSDKQGLISYTLGADGDGCDLLHIPGGGTRSQITESTLDGKYIRMDGRAVFKWAVRLISDTIRDVLEHSGLDAEDLDLLVLHQANQRIIDAAMDDLGIPREKVLNNLDRYGNTSAASIPLVLADANELGLLTPGSKILVSGFGAGLAWGTGILQW